MPAGDATGTSPPQRWLLNNLQEQLRELKTTEAAHHKENTDKIDAVCDKVILLQATVDMLVKAAWFVFGAVMLAVIGGVMNMVINREPTKAADAARKPPAALASPLAPPMTSRRAESGDP